MGITYEEPKKDRLHDHFLKSESDTLDSAQAVDVAALARTASGTILDGQSNCTITIPEGGFVDTDYEAIAADYPDLYVSNLTTTTIRVNSPAAVTGNTPVRVLLLKN